MSTTPNANTPTPARAPAMSDKRAEEIIGILLRTGVTIAAVIVFLAAMPYLVQHGAAKPDYHIFHGEPSQLRHISAIVKGSLARDPTSIIQLGLLLLIATPVARVAFSVFAFAAERDGMYVAITLIVLALLIYSLSATNL